MAQPLTHRQVFPASRCSLAMRIAGAMLMLAALSLLTLTLLELLTGGIPTPAPAEAQPESLGLPYGLPGWPAAPIYGLALLLIGLLLFAQGEFQRHASQLELEIDPTRDELRLDQLAWPLEAVAGLEVLEPERRGRGLTRPLGWRVMLRLRDGARLALLEKRREAALEAVEALARQTGLERVFGEPEEWPPGAEGTPVVPLPRISPVVPADSYIEQRDEDGGVRFRWSLEGTPMYRRYLVAVLLLSATLLLCYDAAWLAVLTGRLEPPGALFTGWAWPLAVHLIVLPFALRSPSRLREEREAWEEVLETPDMLRYAWSDGRHVSAPIGLSSRERVTLCLASPAPGHFHLETRTPAGWVLIGRAIRGRTRLRAVDLAALLARWRRMGR